MTQLSDASDHSAAERAALAAPAAPVLLFLGGAQAFADLLDALGAALGVGILRVEPGPGLAAALHATHPIGFVCGMEDAGATAACHAMKTVARYDPDLPMLLVTDDNPETLGCLDAIAALCAVTELTRLTAPPRPEEILAFLARAGRRSGQLQLMPV